MRQPLTGTPTALPNTTAGTFYSLQNRSRHALYVEVAVAAPTDGGGANVVAQSTGSEDWPEFSADAGESIWVWVDVEIASGVVIYNQAG